MITSLQNRLTECGIRPSIQRIAIMDYMIANRIHPTADQIFEALRGSIPTLSRTTVYNTVGLLAKNGAIRALDIDSGQMHYDGDTSPHAHFMCTGCGKIHDIMLSERGWHLMQKAIELPDELAVESVQLTFKGMCPECAAKSKKC